MVNLWTKDPMTASGQTRAPAFIELLLEQPGASVCLLGPDDRVLHANDEWLRSHGLERAQAIGKTILDLRHELRGQGWAGHAGPGLASAGEDVPWEGSITPVAMEGGVGLLFTSREGRREAREGGSAAGGAAPAATPEAFLDALFTGGTVGLGFLDRELRFVRVNPALAELDGLPPDAHVGRRPSELTPAAPVVPGMSEIETGLRRVLETGMPALDVEVSREAPGGRRSWLHSWFPLVVAGEIVGVGAVAREVTTQRNVERALHHSEADVTELKQEEAALRESDRRKSEFLGVLSHELRNPLGSISSSIHVLNRVPAGSWEAASARQIIQRQTVHLTRIVDDLLDVARISTGRIELHRSRIDVRELVSRSCADHRDSFDRKRLELHQRLPAAPAWIDADATRLSQVLGNLLHNAVKFTPAGGDVTVEVAAQGGSVELSVRDTGVGMRPEEVERMFEPFAQAEQGLARTQGGLGLGLALSRGLVELHGGSMRARSNGPGRGSEFQVLLPMAEPAAGAAARGPGTPAGGRLVLLIESSSDACESLSMALSLAGHRVRTAHDGKTGIAAAREFRPDAVLCDIGLPDIDGYQVARTLRSDEALRATRLIALSGHARLEDRRRAAEAGFDAHVLKPPALDELAELLANA
jgi:signal transduction histidine kinase/CheY-like chemotaxis protein